MCNIRVLTFTIFSISMSGYAYAMEGAGKAIGEVLDSMLSPASLTAIKKNKNDLEQWPTGSIIIDQEFFNRCDKSGVNPNMTTFSTGETVLIFACKHDRQDIVEKLITYSDANPNVQDNEGNTALYYACKNKNLKIVELLVPLNANPNIKNKAGVSPLDLARKGAYNLEDDTAVTMYNMLVEAFMGLSKL